MENKDYSYMLSKILMVMFNKNLDGFSPDRKDMKTVFISFSSSAERAITFAGTGSTIDTALNNAKRPALMHIKNKGVEPKWIYMDFVQSEEKITKEKFLENVNKTKVNYYRHGFSFDDDYKFAFLEQEINGSVLLNNKAKPIVFHDANLTSFLRSKGIIGKTEEFNQDKLRELIVFECKSCFYDLEKDEYHDLYSSGLQKGIRKYMPVEEFWIRNIIDTGKYLNSTVKDDGSFVYGYFPCYGNIVPTYNITRHCLSVIALIELYDFWTDEGLKENIIKTFDFCLREAVKEIDNECSVVIDKANNDEIRLGALGLAILMIISFTDFIESDKYIPIAGKLANCILKMQDKDSGNFVHVLQYPDMSVKEHFKIIYYSGEACFGLLRLYGRVKDERYLLAAKSAFNFFIEREYHKYYDHWLAYSVNELIKYAPDDEYFEFALKNAMNRIDFIIDRQTTWATFLEMLNASFGVIESIKELSKEYLLSAYDMSKFYNAVAVRVKRQMNGIMFPEMAMFFKNPNKILYGSYIRHHSFRIRNDDVAHHLIGYCRFVRNVYPYNEKYNIFNSAVPNGETVQ